MRILSAEAMRQVDRAAIEDLGIPSLVLMENAAIGVADAIGQRFPEAGSVAIFCGPGNNGGDGLALARHLAARGYLVRIGLAAGGREPGGDAGVQLAICRRSGLTIEEIEGAEGLKRAAGLCGGCELVVDALFGTGLTRPLEGDLAALVEELNRAERPRVAVDLASGLAGGSGSVPGPHVRADLTVTFAAPKIAHIFPPAAWAAGEVVVADLGIPPALIETAEGDLRLLSAEELRHLLGARRSDGHKGDYGHLLIVAGSEGKSGAAVLAARAAVRSGAGLVTLAVPESLLPVAEAASLESMTLPLPMTATGGLGAEAGERVLEALEGKRAVAVGPGLGQHPDTVDTIRRLVEKIDRSLIIDADGLNALTGELGRLAERRGETVLTPHPGELARLLGTSTAAVLEDRPAAVREAMAASGAVVVLKGHLSLVGDPAGELGVNPTGNPGMASGGTGDVLTGMIGGLSVQGLGAADAARLGVFLHGLAGDLAAAELGMVPLRAGDLLEVLPAAFARLGGG